MKPNLYSLVFFFLIFPFHTTTLLTAAATDNLIKETCRKCAKNDPNINYSFCLTSLQASPDRHCATNLRQLGIISIDLTRHNVTDTRRYIKKLLKNKKLDPDVRACISDCLDLYSDAIPSLKQAIKYYKSKNYGDANIQVSSVLDASTTCNDGFNEKGVLSPLDLDARNNHTFQLSAIALSIINMLP